MIPRVFFAALFAFACALPAIAAEEKPNAGTERAQLSVLLLDMRWVADML